MATTCKVIGGKMSKEKKRPIEFIENIGTKKGYTRTIETLIKPNDFLNIELIQSSKDYKNYDIIFAYDDDRSKGMLFLGHWNDGIV